MNRICRICLIVSEKEMVDLSTPYIELIEILSAIKITLEEKVLLQKICQQCIEEIERLAKFRSNLIKNHQTLIKKFQSGEQELHQFYKDLTRDKNIILEENTQNIDHKIFEDKTDNIDYKSQHDSDLSSEENVPLFQIKDEAKPKKEIKKVKETDDEVNLEKEQLKCLTCFSCFDSRQKLTSHYKNHSEKIKLTNENNFEVLNKDGVNVFKCLLCDKSFKEKRCITRHIISHVNCRPYVCNVCGRTYKTASDIVRHGRAHETTKLLACSVENCSYTTSYMGALKIHKLGHKAEYKYKCPDCDKGFHVKTWCDQHQNIHSGLKPFICKICDNAFHMDRYLKSHISKMHPQSTDVKRHVCVKCGHQCDTRVSLKKHFEVHGDKQTHLCDICGKSLASSDQLNIHRKRHLGIKPHVCSTCGKGFVKRSNLKNHEITHSGTKPYTCDICDRKFTQKCALVLHNSRYHSENRPFHCGKCKEGFIYKHQLAKHEPICQYS